MDAVLALIDKALEALSNPMVAAGVAFVVDFILKKLPSEKPLGVIHSIAGILRMAAGGLLKLAELSDKVFPQTIKQPPKQ